MKKTVAIMALLVLAACQTTTPAEQPQPTGFRFGTEGLRISFAQNLPPPRLFGRDDFVALIETENKGTADITRANIFLSGYDPNIISGVPTFKSTKPLKGRSAYVSQGDFTTVEFRGQISQISAMNIDKYQTNLLATACYQYQTTASANVCIDPNPFAPTRREKVCTPTNIPLGSQGAPIAVNLIEIEPAPSTTRFRIHISNTGGGTVYKPEAINRCSPYSEGLQFEDADYIRVQGVTVSGQDITPSCQPLTSRGLLRLNNNAGTLFCSFDTSLQGESPYMTPININLQYGYRQSAIQPIEILPST